MDARLYQNVAKYFTGNCHFSNRFFLAKRIKKIAANLIVRASTNTTLNGLFASIIYFFLLALLFLLY